MAKRLIDANAYAFPGDLINEPTVDAVEVVRCRDCIHDGMSTCPMCYIEDKTLVFVNHDPDFHCGEGERKGGQAPPKELLPLAMTRTRLVIATTREALRLW